MGKKIKILALPHIGPEANAEERAHHYSLFWKMRKLRDSSLDLFEKKIEVKDKVGCSRFRRVWKLNCKINLLWLL